MISIIVPVYNGEDHLEKCVRSILAQTERDIQLVLINDGSTDATAGLCDRLAGEDQRITVIHQKNAGVSAARNAGLDAAKGEYIGFVDADDWIAPDAYEQALEAMDGCDIGMWDTVTVFDDGRTEPDTIPMLEQDRVLEKKDWAPELLRWMAGSACRCLYRSELLTDVRFPVGIKLSEDRLFNLQAMGKAATLHYIKKGLYFRYMRAGSACNRYHGDRFEKGLCAAQAAAEMLERYWTEDYIPGYRKLFIVGSALDAIGEICGPAYPGKNRLQAVREIAAHPALRDVFAQCTPEGIREKLLCRRMCLALLMLERIRS